jgi:LysM repeat protein
MTQDDVSNALEKVYDKYQSSLIMDGAKSYTVESGDTLSAITRNFYPNDNAFYFPVIMLASNDVVVNPDLIEPGMKLSIPDLKVNLDNAATKEKIKSYLLEIARVYANKGDGETEKGLQDLSASLYFKWSAKNPSSFFSLKDGGFVLVRTLGFVFDCIISKTGVFFAKYIFVHRGEFYGAF